MYSPGGVIDEPNIIDNSSDLPARRIISIFYIHACGYRKCMYIHICMLILLRAYIRRASWISLRDTAMNPTIVKDHKVNRSRTLQL